MVKYCFVILHFIDYEMTKKCIDDLLYTFGDNNYRVIAVDNGSPNNSGKQLKDHFKNNELVTVLLNQKNEGFARGNNIGYSFAKTHYNPDFIIVMNNDVLIDQKDFLERIETLYKKNNYAVLGPDIFNPKKNTHQNPISKEIPSVQSLETSISKKKQYLQHPAFFYLRRSLGIFLKNLIKRKTSDNNRNYTTFQEDVVLHGACYIFSPQFISRRDHCFCPDTFLYMEEYILYYECKKDGLKMLYSPEVKVTHLEDVSTNAVTKTGLNKFKMQNEEVMKSSQILLNKLKSGNEI